MYQRFGADEENVVPAKMMTWLPALPLLLTRHNNCLAACCFLCRAASREVRAIVGKHHVERKPWTMLQATGARYICTGRLPQQVPGLNVVLCKAALHIPACRIRVRLDVYTHVT
jgi:hypothetical protein